MLRSPQPERRFAFCLRASVGSTEVFWDRRAQEETKVMGGLAGLVRGIAIGSVPLVIASCAALFGAVLALAVAD
jgi:hypothetical protein